MVEDHLFDPEESDFEGQLEPGEFWNLLSQRTYSSLRDIFGPSLERHGRTCYVAPGEGYCSLGYLVTHFFGIGVDFGKVRASIQDSVFGQLSVAVTDLRLYEEDHETVNINVLQNIQRRIGELTSGGAILSVGLSRPSPRISPYGHWLQVNNIHFRQYPLWEPGDFQ